jgi:GNAT superfamily N-acetyltransferase
MTACDLRIATIDDAESLADLITQLGYPTTAAAMRGRLEAIASDSSYATFVAVASGSIVGLAAGRLGQYYEKDGTYCQLVVLSVASGARQQGIGKRLVAAVERWGRDNGVRAVVVTTALHRDGAHAFYERCGYSRTGFRFVKELTAQDKDVATRTNL